MFLSTNIKLLRNRRNLTQSDLAESLDIKRSSVNNYENGTTTPPVSILMALSDLFSLSLDTLLRINLSSLRESQLYVIENGSDMFVKGNELRVLATTVDANNEDNIELVSIKAKAGYTTGYFDPEYVSQLPTFQLPFLSKEKKYRTFQISGESMLPIPDGSYVTGEFVQDLRDIKSGELYIVISLNEGIVFKQVENELEEKGSLRLISTNPEFDPYDLPLSEVREVWKFDHFISREIPEMSNDQVLLTQMKEVKRDIRAIKKRMDS